VGAAQVHQLDVALNGIYIARMLVSTRRPRRDWDRRALALRDLALIVVTTKGEPVETRDGLHLVSYADERIRIAYHPKEIGSELPNGIDVWRNWISDTDGAKATKVLSIVWDDKDAVVVAYYGGLCWETALRRAATAASVARAN
jgi:hypothetical protein